MIRRTVVYAPEAEGDLLSLFDHIADAASEAVAAGYLGRIKVWLEGFSTASERGTRRDDIRPGLRIIGFERRLTVAFTVTEDTVVIQRVFSGGQNWGARLEDGGAS